MNIQPPFAISVLMSFVAFGVVTKLYLWPWLQTRRRNEALLALVVPHLFRFVGLSFLVPGVVSPSCRERSPFLLPTATSAPPFSPSLPRWRLPGVRAGPSNAGRCVVHPDCDRAAGADHTWVVAAWQHALGIGGGAKYR